MTVLAGPRLAEIGHVRARERLGAFLRARYPLANRTALLAADIGVSERAARNLLENHWPGDEVFDTLLAFFGRSLEAELCDPVIDPMRAQAAAKVRAAEEELERARALERQLDGSGAALPARPKRRLGLRAVLRLVHDAGAAA